MVNILSDFQRLYVKLVLPGLAFLLLFGLTFCLLGADLLHLPWRSAFSVSFYGSTAGAVLIIFLSRFRKFCSFTAIDLLALLFLILVVGSLVVNGNSKDFIYSNPRFMPFLVIAPYLCGKLMDGKDVYRFFGLLLYASIPLVVISIFVKLDFFTLSLNHSYLLIGNVLAPAALGMVVYMICQNNFKLKKYSSDIIIYGFLFLCIVVMVLVGARGAYIAFIVTLLFLVGLGVYLQFRVQKIFLIFCFSALSLVAVLNVAPDPRRIEIIQKDVALEGLDLQPEKLKNDDFCLPIIEGKSSIKIRSVLFIEAISLIKSRPLWGVHANMFGLYSCLGKGGYPHSTILQAFAELGIIGGILLLGMYIRAFYVLFIVGEKIKKNTRLKCCKTGYNVYVLFLVVGFFVLVSIFDQIYGNYFFASGTSFVLGLISNLSSSANKMAVG